MSEREQPAQQHDAVDEALARAELPVAYRGDVRGEDVRVLGYVGQEGPTLEAQVVFYEDPDGNAVPEASYAVPVETAVQLLGAIDSFAETYGLDVEAIGGEQA